VIAKGASRNFSELTVLLSQPTRGVSLIVILARDFKKFSFLSVGKVNQLSFFDEGQYEKERKTLFLKAVKAEIHKRMSFFSCCFLPLFIYLFIYFYQSPSFSVST